CHLSDPTTELECCSIELDEILSVWVAKTHTALKVVCVDCEGIFRSIQSHGLVFQIDESNCTKRGNELIVRNVDAQSFKRFLALLTIAALFRDPHEAPDHSPAGSGSSNAGDYPAVFEAWAHIEPPKQVHAERASPLRISQRVCPRIPACNAR